MMFARKAEGEGFPNVGRLFRTAAEAERIHAEGHLAVLQEVKTTAQNLQAGIDGETHEFKEMYPPMLAQAEAEGHKVKRMFGHAVKAEAVHAKLYAFALEAAKQGKDMEETQFYLCPVCGNIEMGRTAPGVDVAEQLAGALGVAVCWLAYGEGDVEPPPRRRRRAGVHHEEGGQSS